MSDTSSVRKSPDADLRKLLADTIALIEEYGSRSEQVKQFVQQHRKLDEFVDLVATLIHYYETRRKDFEEFRKNGTFREALRSEASRQ